MNIISFPCNKKFKYDPNYIFCTGCFRSSDEISNWVYFSENTRIGIMKLLPNRKKTLKRNDEK
jgi:predicted Fe-S protein YdhL (DUF1289 family)